MRTGNSIGLYSQSRCCNKYCGLGGLVSREMRQVKASSSCIPNFRSTSLHYRVGHIHDRNMVINRLNRKMPAICLRIATIHTTILLPENARKEFYGAVIWQYLPN